MIKRMNKVTSLLVAAAAMVSVVPASASEKIATQDGTIYNAVAFDGGKYLFEGYKNDEDNSGVYFNNGNKDKLLEDLDGYSSFEKYGTKSVIASKDSDDQYIVDMSTGNASDDENMDDITTNLENKLNSTFRKLDRYNKAKSAVTSLEQISDKTFGEVWFKYKATTDNGVEATGYTNESGKYIDASVTANISVFNGTKMVKVEEFGEKEDGVTATIDGDAEVIGQDSNYIYRIVNVNFEGAAVKSATYLQKISKAQGSTKDDAYLPKTVESFQIMETNQDEDINDAAIELSKEDNKYTVVDGTVYSYRYDGSRVNVSKFSTKRNEKLEYTLTSGAVKELDTAVVKLVDTIDEKCDKENKETITTDVDGNVWFLNNGKIYRSVKGGDFEVMYTCDRTMNKLDVYNASNLIVWNQENEIFATVAGSNASAEEDNKEDNKVEVVAGWVKNSDGTWSYNKADGTKATGWLNDNGTWYYLNNSGVMRTGWLNDNGTWYYLQSSGAMKTGWLNDNGTWYYLQSSGAMKTGWLNDNGTWYYLKSSGAMAANTTVDGYRLGANGAWIR